VSGGAGSVRAPFTALADVYDTIMQDVPYEAWCTFLLRLVTARGWSGGRLLDVGCGTGNATLPMLARGYEVVAVDASPAMAARARAKCPQATVVVADVRDLALDPPVDLAYAVFDTLNTLPDEATFVQALRAVHAVLAPGGWFVFDANTTAGLRELGEEGLVEGWAVAEDGDVHYRWHHVWDEAAGVATVDAACEGPAGAFVERHVERPFDPPVLLRAMHAAGFEAVEVVAYPDGRAADEHDLRVWALGRRPAGC